MSIECPKCHTENPDDSKFCRECATPFGDSGEIEVSHTKTLETPVDELTTGTTFANRYQIIEELGKGGMGKVYKAHDAEIREKVALKLIKPEIASEERTIERFRNEIKLARKIAHRNVCKMYDLGESHGRRFISMEYVPGENLKSFIKRSGKLTVDKAISIAKQVANGLAEAHRMEVVHRDLKPSNVMVDKDGNAKIMDFGIARSMKAEGLTGTGYMVGTPEYMSPEQAEGIEVDERSDIYALGVILYEMLTGGLPFEGETPLSVAMKHKSELPRNPRELNVQIPDDLGRLILRCLEKEQSKRYQTADELTAGLNNIEVGTSKPEKVLLKKKSVDSVKKLLVPSFVILLLILTVILALKYIPPKEKVSGDQNKPSIAIMYFKNNTGEEGLDHWRDALATWLITDLSQSKYVDVLSGDRLYGTLRKLNLHEAKTYAVEDYFKIAEHCRVSHILQASFSKAEDIFRIDYSLKSAATMENLRSDFVSGQGEVSFMHMLDELTKKIKGDLELSSREISSDIDKDLAQISTNSEAAYKNYTQGMRLFHAGGYRQSVAFFEEAVRIDPEFAMAFKSLSAAYRRINDYTKYRMSQQKALDLIDRVSERERYLIIGSYHMTVDRDAVKAMDAYTSLLDIYPDDIEGNSSLGEIYVRFGEYERALMHFEEIYKKERNYNSLMGLVNQLLNTGHQDRAIEVCEDYLETVEDNPRVHSRLAIMYAGRGRFDLALEENEKVIKINPDLDAQNVILYVKKDFQELEEHLLARFEQYEEKNQSRIGMRRFLANACCGMGQFEKAIQHLHLGIEQAEEYGPKIWIVRLNVDLVSLLIQAGKTDQAKRALNSAMKVVEELKINTDLIQPRLVAINLVQGSIDKALAAAEEQEKQFLAQGRIIEERGLIRNRMRILTLSGQIELAKGNCPEAVRILENALALDSRAPVNQMKVLQESLGQAYYKAGMLTKAAREYEKIIHNFGYQYDIITYILPLSYYMLGKINEELKNTEVAMKYYEKFLDLWKDADPGLPEVDDAKKRLTKLTTH